VSELRVPELRVPELRVPELIPEPRLPRAVPELLVPDDSDESTEGIEPVTRDGTDCSYFTRDWCTHRDSASPRLPAALRSVPCHSVQLRSQIDRRQSPEVSFALLGLLIAVVFFLFTRMATYRQTPLNYFLSVVWSIYARLMLIGFAGAFYLRSPQRRGRVLRTGRGAVAHGRSSIARHAHINGHKPLRSNFSGRTDHLLVVTVPTLLAAGNLPALRRVLLSLLINLPQHFDRFHVDVITEGAVDHQPLMHWLDEIGE
jgi:hypothetical protein